MKSFWWYDLTYFQKLNFYNKERTTVSSYKFFAQKAEWILVKEKKERKRKTLWAT